MRNTGSDDYIWISSTGEMTIYGNEHTWGTWTQYGVVYNINQAKRDIHFADFDGDGKCDISELANSISRVLIAQRLLTWPYHLVVVDKNTGSTIVLKNNYANCKFSFTNLGVVTGSAGCTQGYGYDRHDNGVRWNDIDGDGMY